MWGGLDVIKLHENKEKRVYTPGATEKTVVAADKATKTNPHGEIKSSSTGGNGEEESLCDVWSANKRTAKKGLRLSKREKIKLQLLI